MGNFNDKTNDLVSSHSLDSQPFNFNFISNLNIKHFYQMKNKPVSKIETVFIGNLINNASK